MHLLLCLFVWDFLSHLRIIHSYVDVPITGEEQQIWPILSWLLSSEGSLACHTYCDMGHQFYYGYLQGLMTLTPIGIWQRSRHYLFLRLRSVAPGIWTPTLSLFGANALTYCTNAVAAFVTDECMNWHPFYFNNLKTFVSHKLNCWIKYFNFNLKTFSSVLFLSKVTGSIY